MSTRADLRIVSIWREIKDQRKDQRSFLKLQKLDTEEKTFRNKICFCDYSKHWIAFLSLVKKALRIAIIAKVKIYRFWVPRKCFLLLWRNYLISPRLHKSECLLRVIQPAWRTYPSSPSVSCSHWRRSDSRRAPGWPRWRRGSRIVIAWISLMHSKLNCRYEESASRVNILNQGTYVFVAQTIPNRNANDLWSLTCNGHLNSTAPLSSMLARCAMHSSTEVFTWNGHSIAFRMSSASIHS